MSRDKQIEEMAKVLYESDNKRNVVICGIETVAEDIYNAGYRKSTYVAEEIFAEIESIVDKSTAWNGNIYSLLLKSDFAKLKKKYTEGGE